jgi:hypothetical protein
MTSDVQKLHSLVSLLQDEVKHAYTEGFFCGAKGAEQGFGDDSQGHPVKNAEFQWAKSQAKGVRDRMIETLGSDPPTGA